MDDDTMFAVMEMFLGPQQEGMFKSAYGELKGKDWVRQLLPEDRQVFSHIGRVYAQHGRLGGLARAKTARRDHRGRFVKES